MPDHDLEALARAARRKRRLPANASCEACGRAHHLSARADGRILCYACAVAAAGRRPFEEDHLAGRLNLGGLVVRLEPNAHREATELRTLLGKDDWPDANGDPLLVLAHFLCGLATLLVVVARWLVELAAQASERLGPAVWAGTVQVPVVA